MSLSGSFLRNARMSEDVGYYVGRRANKGDLDGEKLFIIYDI